MQRRPIDELAIYGATDGYNGTMGPYFTFQYWWQTRRLALDDYETVAPAAERSRQGATCQVPSGVRTAMSRGW